MTCVSKEYEIKTKMVSFLAAVIARLQLKKIFLLVSFYLVRADLTFGEEGIKILWAESLPGGIFPGGGGRRKFLAGWGDSPPHASPHLGKPCVVSSTIGLFAGDTYIYQVIKSKEDTTALVK